MSSAVERPRNGTNAADEFSPLKRAILEIRQLRARLERVEQGQREPIAIVGLGLRFPGGARDPESFWALLTAGRDAITEVPRDRWDVDALYDPDPDRPGKLATRYGGFLDHVDRFDASFFGIAPREAVSVDPQHRLLLEVAWEALEHAGQSPDQLFGSRTGVFIGISNSDYWRLLLADRERLDAYATSGSAPSIAAGRLAYTLGLRGPAVALDTACSSSLVAVHLAVQSLRAGESDLALAGGVNLVLAPELTVNFSRARMLAADGRCKTFDARADGYVRSEGCGLVVLKRLSDALAAGDNIVAVVRGTAVNQDGRSGGLTAPNGPAQEAVIRAALANAGVEPARVGYVEAHGTGTSLGDPIELHALAAVLSRERPAARPLVVGSVKTNLGHLEAAAGVAGLIKAALVLQQGEVPPHLHLQQLNPHITLGDARLVIPTERMPWADDASPRVAGVSSFGLSGTNAHVVLEQAPARAPLGPGAELDCHVLALSARTETALGELARRYADHLLDHPEQALADVCFTASAGRAHHPERLALVGASRTELAERLRAASSAGEPVGVFRGRASAADAPLVAFLFTGQGAQHANMARGLYDTEPVFRAALQRCAALLDPLLDQPLLGLLFPDRAPRREDDALVRDMAYAQPAQFAVQYALAELWRSWGIVPTHVAGHSLGEYAAACVAGVFSLADGLRLVAARGRLLQSLPEQGEMVAIFADEAQVARALGAYHGAAAIAAVNGATSLVVSGRSAAVRGLIADLGLSPEEWRRLEVPAASHSPLVDPVLGAFEAAAAEIVYQPPQIPLVSTLTGGLACEAELTTPGYWRRHLRQTVRFAPALDALRAQGCDIFVEIGPHPVLLGLGRRHVPDGLGTWLPTLRHDRDDREQVRESLAELYVHGVPVDWDGFHRDQPHRRVPLPTYPFERQRYWAPSAAGAASLPSIESGWDRALAAAERQAQQGPLDLHLPTYPAKWECLNRLAIAYILRTLRDLGAYRRAGEVHHAADLVAAHGIAPEYEKLVGRWLEGLIEAGVCARQTDGRVACQAPLPEPDVPALERAAAAALADVRPLLDYVRRCGERLPAILTGEESPLETLFPGGSFATADYLYRDWPVARYRNAIAAAVVESIVHGRPGPLQMLEIGGGTGAATHALLPLLPRERAIYHFTDVSDFFLHRAREQFAAYPFVRYGLLDIERNPADQGYAPHRFDVVVASQVLHATRDLEAALAHLRRLLAPGGLLVVSEATAHPRWFDVTTGLVAAAQRLDGPTRAAAAPLAAEEWARALAKHGFEAVGAFPDAESPCAVLGQHVLVARGPAEVAEAPDRGSALPCPEAATAARLSDEAPRSPEAVNSHASQPAETRLQTDPFGEQLRAALPGERRELLVDYVRGHIARVLRLDDARAIAPYHRLLDLGLDSLMAVELRDRLAKGLSLPRALPATLVFDCPTTAAIAGYLDRQLSAVQPDAVPPLAATEAPLSASDTSLSRRAAVAELTDDEVAQLLMQKLERT